MDAYDAARTEMQDLEFDAFDPEAGACYPNQIIGLAWKPFRTFSVENTGIWTENPLARCIAARHVTWSRV